MASINTDDMRSRQMIACGYCDKVCQRRRLKEHTKTAHEDKQPKEK